MFNNGMTMNQKAVAKSLRNSGFSRHDSKIYAAKTSDFMFQTGVNYVSGVMVAATVGAARLAGKGVGFVAGSTVNAISGAIEKKKASKVTAGAKPSKEEKRAEKAAKKAEKFRNAAKASAEEVELDEAEEVEEEVEIEDTQTLPETTEEKSESDSNE